MGKIKNCERCGKEFEDKHRDGKRFCSKVCSALFNAKIYINGMVGRTGANNPNWKNDAGKKICENCGSEYHSYSTKQKFCSRKCKGESSRKKFAIDSIKKLKTSSRKEVKKKQKVELIVSQKKERKIFLVKKICVECGKEFERSPSIAQKRRFCSIQCSNKNVDKNKRLQESRKGYSPSVEQRQKISRAASRRSSGQTNYSTGSQGFYYSHKGKREVWYRSIYELVAYKILDNDPYVESYTPEPFLIEYNIPGEVSFRLYRPDILVCFLDGHKELIEVKPQWEVKKGDIKLISKVNAGKEYCQQNGIGAFRVWTEKELGLSQAKYMRIYRELNKK